MKKLRKYGNTPFNIAVIHGGPGGAGEVAPVAEELSTNHGILEPFQQSQSIEGQVKELAEILKKNASFPVTLIGYSWGTWLSLIFAANYPQLVKKLILIGTPPLKPLFGNKIMKTRLSRLTDEEQAKYTTLISQFNSSTKEKNHLMKQLHHLILKTDSFAPTTSEDHIVDYNYEIFEKVWSQASDWRKKVKLLEVAKKIQCPVVAIHGDYDPHPAEETKKPLTQLLKNFKFILLEKCGHSPWIEKYAKDAFYATLKRELD
ncbi:TPA: alpha/beta hydrolase [Candidatus Dependentiae bacterium]|nr:MAG: hypothetical protein US03_C0003G0068 [candidate division TM6 bacterium GW2011_GWF2_36_131]KKQ03387.1 MAG: hypothetical protein US13_C0003G0068 [candidate division TM6 bacterium GW2011_GWE2_36_25]KKQ18932.1 MAG: hypothetical protein US32_C0020G0004 [candidate division TM6 bacterium GW2011_GWA2_36_9]HBR70833.1 alpha/beta hydrolase [Candidatus Dependentiae bacterium]HCU00564.1 alpha/beta hydrolase [Candidatus Dependentiae bacterium]